MANNQFKFLDTAIELARCSDLYKWRVGAIMISKSGYFYAYSTRKKHPALKKHGYPSYVGQHAEFRLLLRNAKEAHKSTVYIARINRQNQPRLAKPCKECRKLLKDFGVKSVVFTTDDGAGIMTP